MKEPFVIFMCGLPLSGKSTFYSEHLSQLDHILLSTDHYIDQECNKVGLTYNQGFDLYIKEACSDLVNNLKLSTRYNKNIIIDQTNLNIRSRKKKLRMIPEYYHKMAIFIPIDTEESLSRNTRPGKIIPEFVIRSMTQSIQLPTIEEGYDQVFIGVDSFLSAHLDEPNTLNEVL